MDQEWSAFSLFECDVLAGDLKDLPDADTVSAVLFGRIFVEDPAVDKRQESFSYPEGMVDGPLYPDMISTFIDPEDDRVFKVPCHNLPDYDVQRAECAAPFLQPIDANHREQCILPCPVPAFTEGQYSTMWILTTSIGMVGLGLNLFMALTWAIGGKKVIDETNFFLKMCVFYGLLYGLVRHSCSFFELELSPTSFFTLTNLLILR